MYSWRLQSGLPWLACLRSIPTLLKSPKISFPWFPMQANKWRQALRNKYFFFSQKYMLGQRSGWPWITVVFPTPISEINGLYFAGTRRCVCSGIKDISITGWCKTFKIQWCLSSVECVSKSEDQRFQKRGRTRWRVFNCGIMNGMRAFLC